MHLHVTTTTEWNIYQEQLLLLLSAMKEENQEFVLYATPGAEIVKRAVSVGIVCRELKTFSLLNITKSLKHTPIDVIHSHDFRALKLCIALKGVLKAPLVYSYRPEQIADKGMINRTVLRSKRVDRFICSCSEAKTEMIIKGVPVDKISVLRPFINGMEQSQVNPKHIIKNSLPPHSFLIGTVAPLEDGSDLTTIIRAAEIVLKNKRDLLFMIVGQGKQMKELNQALFNRKVRERFILETGNVNYYEYITAMDLFISSGKVVSPTFRLVDAFKSKVACIATAVGIAPGLITNRKNGVLIPKKDHHAMSQAIELLINDYELRNELAEAGYKYIEDLQETPLFVRYTELYNLTLETYSAD